MNVFYACDDKYAMILGISLTSLYFFNKDVEQVDVYVVDDKIGDKNKERLIETAKDYRRKLTFVKKPKMEWLLGCKPDTLKWSDNTFCRLYMPTILADYPNLERILYIDCDTLICGNLEPLWKLNLNGKLCAAGLECMGRLHKKLIGLGKQDPYVNAGVLLVDMKKWRAECMERKCTEYLQRHARCLEYLDESTLNSVVREQICVFPPEYNLTTLKCNYSYNELKVYRKSAVMYSQKAYQEALEHPVIVHYTDNFLVRRPWLAGEGNTHYFEKQFLENKDKSYWATEPLPEERISGTKRFARKLSKYNRWLVIIICGIMYSYIKPLKYFYRQFIDTCLRRE